MSLEKDVASKRFLLTSPVSSSVCTFKALDLFKEHVMVKNTPAEEADVILTTCHSAKGLEWDNVQAETVHETRRSSRCFKTAR